MNYSLVWRVLMVLWTASEVGIPVFTRTRQRDGNVQDRGSLRILWSTIMLSITAGDWFGATRRHTIDGGNWLAPLVTTLFISGLAIPMDRHRYTR